MLLRSLFAALVLVPLAAVPGSADNAPAQGAAPATLPLVPQPVVADQPAGAAPYAVTSQTGIRARGTSSKAIADRLAGLLRTATGHRVPVSSRSGAITITVDPAADYTVDGAAPAPESYVLDVDRTGVDITARTAHGAFNAVQTLRQLLPGWVNAGRRINTPWQVPAVHIEDAPRFAYRGVMLDVARSFQDADAVKRYIDTLVQLKMSHLHLHLADDQGWRIEITNEDRAAGDTIDYRRLTSVSGKTAVNDLNRGYQRELGRTGYYTQAEYRSIVKYARDRFVTIVPEIDVPGHTNAALHAIPQLNTDRSLPARDPETGVVDWNGTIAVGYSALDEKHQPTYDFVRHVFRQVAEMSESPYVHIGGDESHAMGHTRYVDFIRQAVPAVREATGVGTIGWSEYAEAGLDQGAGYWDGSVVQYWVGSGDWVRDFVAKGGKAVISDADGSYLDMKYDPSTPIGLDWACSGDCDFPRYYNWDPTTTVEGGVAESGVLGVEGPLWSETVRGEDQALYLALPRAAAILETGWTAADRKDPAGFAERLGGLGVHLTSGGTNYYESRRATWRASVAGTDVRAGRYTASYDVGLVAAPGTKLSADGTTITPDTITADGDPASKSSLTAPLTAELRCGSTSLPVRFRQEQVRDALHGAGLYTASVRHRFGRSATCTLVPSEGEPVPVKVTVCDDGRAETDALSSQPLLSIGEDGEADAGTWVPLSLSGFAAGYVDIAIDGTLAYRVRADEHGRFQRHGVIAATLYDGDHTVSAAQGDRRAEATLRVHSDLKPLPDLIDQTTLTVHDVDSEETVGEDGAATNAIDGSPESIWHTQWQAATPGFPHHITLDLGREYDVTGLSYLTRQNAPNGRFKDYEIAVSVDGVTWSDPVATGSFTASTVPQNVAFAATRGRYVRLTGLTSIAGNAFGGAAEINVGGLPRG
ncbi:family 20 glycosylhydrolase [Nocardioides speluncae]|uniref:glycoside hydrolase family 20 protein n=1 Tax=Nocardioides speluncae TaxID=2670337 RepID=UPI000D69483E|nr:family 20 glycosylhydrolase [Nocardioides speluncae]